jgi:hypothetical protein
MFCPKREKEEREKNKQIKERSKQQPTQTKKSKKDKIKATLKGEPSSTNVVHSQNQVQTCLLHFNLSPQ